MKMGKTLDAIISIIFSPLLMTETAARKYEAKGMLNVAIQLINYPKEMLNEIISEYRSYKLIKKDKNENPLKSG